MRPHPTIARFLALIAAGILVGCRQETGEEMLFPDDANYAQWVGQTITQAGFHGADLNNNPIDLAKFRGRVLMLDFWASWSPKCMEMFPAKLDAYQKFHHAGLEIVGINADFDRQDLDQVLAKENPPWPQHFNQQGEADAAVKTFGITHFPSIWLVDRQGVVRFISGGRNLEAKIRQLVDESAGPSPVPATKGSEPGWKDRIMSTFSGGSDNDPVAAINSLLAAPDAFLDIKNVMITSKRRIATVKTPEATHQVVIGKEIFVTTDSGPVPLVCKAIESDGLTFVVSGRDTAFKVAF